MNDNWCIKVVISGYYGEVTIEQEAHNGTIDVRKSVVEQAMKLYDKLKEDRDGKSTTT